jgi:hypothetical protein
MEPPSKAISKSEPAAAAGSGAILLPEEMWRHLIIRTRDFHEIVAEHEFQPSFPHLPQDAGA